MLTKLFGGVVLAVGVGLTGLGWHGLSAERPDCCPVGCCAPGSPCCDDCCAPGGGCCAAGADCCAPAPGCCDAK